ncbi:MAG TPA: lipid-A-disaccharide synthase [Gammaproteobacteria bacterium]|nr:lipid-A-disaccharide synthase [Gammaproteobacteria bacterium]
MRVGLVAGEASGDQLGAGLLRALAGREPALRSMGVAGPAMRAAGCEAWAGAEALSVMGLAEVARDLPRLLALRRRLARRFLHDPPDLFVGIDAPDFNLGLERRLHAASIRTAQYVSPSVWAWRQGRLKTIARAVDLVLCLFPFEKDYYDRHGIDAVFVGHPLADDIPLEVDAAAARKALGLDGGGPVVAVLPGSRSGEVIRLGGDFAGAIDWMATRRPDLHFVAPMANSAVREQFEAQLRRDAPHREVTLLDGRAQQAMAAADVVLVASGTATLEAALLRRPMVVAYRLAPATRWILERFRLLKLRRYALPNLLAGEDLVPELLQDEVTPAALGAAVLEQLEDTDRRRALAAAFADMHRKLRRNASQRAAEALLGLAGRQTRA